MRGAYSRKVLQKFERLSPVQAFVFPRPHINPPTVSDIRDHIGLLNNKRLTLPHEPFVVRYRRYFHSTLNCIDRTRIHAGAAINADIRVNDPFIILFVDGGYWAGIIARAAVDTIVINGMCHLFASLFVI